MSSAKSLFNGFTVMIYCILIGIIMNISYAHGLDVMLVKFGTMGMFDVPAVWNSSATVTRLVNLFYLMMYIIPALGVGYFFITAVKRQEYDRYKEPEVQ
jgi:hypothetical protein